MIALTCPECRSPTTCDDSRRMFFRAETQPEKSQEKLQEEIIKMRSETANQERKYLEQLHAETEIRRDNHREIKALKDQNLKLAEQIKQLNEQIQKFTEGKSELQPEAKRLKISLE